MYGPQILQKRKRVENVCIHYISELIFTILCTIFLTELYNTNVQAASKRPPSELAPGNFLLMECLQLNHP